MASTKPSPDEVKALQEARKSIRRKQLERILKNPDLCFLFREHLQAELCAENLAFWMAVETFKNASESELPGLASKFYNLYIKAGALAEVNIDIEERKLIKEKLARPTKDMFNDAQETVYSLMENSCLNKFLESKNYKLCREGKLRPYDQARERSDSVDYIEKYLDRESWYKRTQHT